MARRFARRLAAMFCRVVGREEGPTMARRKDEIFKIRQLLVKRGDFLCGVVREELTMLRHQTGGDVADLASDSAQDELNSQLAEVESRELLEIDTALKRIEEGQYGVCGQCGRPIPLARLKAVPYASLCIDCQRRTENEPTRSPAAAT